MKMTDMEDRCRRNNVRLVGLPEGMEGPDAAGFLRVRHHLVTVTSSYIIASWLLRHQSRQVLITNFQDASASVCMSIAWVLLVMFL